MFGVAGIAGLTECLQGKQTLKDSIVRLEAANLWLLTGGSGSSSPLQLLQSGRLPEIMDQLAGWFDWIIVDSAPVLPMADTSTWMRLVDGIVLVARPGITEASHLVSTLKAIDHRKLIGAVLNCSKRRTDDAYYYKGSSASL
jgi:Mrp family chromosome partitioning ATPase